MPKQYYAQRQHLVNSFDSLLYQLHTVSFFMSPSIWTFICRVLSQFQCSRPKDMDLTHSLRFFYAVIFFLNLPSISGHLAHGAAEGRAIILDFVGMSYVPSKTQLFTLDITILLLQWIMVTLSYETALAESSSEEPDTLLQETSEPPLPTSWPTPTTSAPSSPSSSTTTYFNRTRLYSVTKVPDTTGPPCIADLRLQPVITRLRNPAPVIAQQGANGLSLPFPNTTQFPIPAGVRMLMRSQLATRRNTENTATDNGNGNGGNGRENRIPGSIDGVA